jgi:hypothetical protein
MASQFASIAPIPFPAPRSVRIAYSASHAATAVQDKLADLPAHKRDATLEELTVIALADQAVAQARDLLSKRMFAAFLDWAQAATLVETSNGGDDEATGDELDRLQTAQHAIGSISSANTHDIGLKTYIAMIEYGDCPSFGPVAEARVTEPGAQLGLIDDLLRMSPLLDPLNQLAATAWSFSPPAAFAGNIGQAIAGRFAAARDNGVAASLGTAPDVTGHSNMDWKVLVGAYNRVRAAEEAYDREFCSIDDTLPLGPDRNAAVKAIPRRHWDESDRLANLRHDCEQQLLRQPSPNAAAFAFKVLICRGEGRNFDAFDELLEQEAKWFSAADPATAWSQALAIYQAARATYETHYCDVLLPADARYKEGTAQWPAGYNFAADTVAKAARDAVDYRDVEDRSNELVSAYVEAMRQLLTLPGRNVADLATKLEIPKREEASTLTDIDDIVAQLAADARALAGGVSPVEVQ